MNEQPMTNDDDLIELGCGGSFTMTTRVLTSVNVERIKGALASTIHEMPLGLTREERRAFILAAAKSDVQTISVHCDKCEGTGYET